jgi:hypothetical protein
MAQDYIPAYTGKEALIMTHNSKECPCGMPFATTYGLRVHQNTNCPAITPQQGKKLAGKIKRKK